MSGETQTASYQEYVRSLVPFWLRRRRGGDFADALGVMKDGHVELLSQAVKARMPKVAPSDALPAIGWERDLERYPGDTDASYRLRLRNAHATYRKSGSDLAIRDAFAELGLTCRIKRNNSWDWDPNPARRGNVAYYWSRLWVIVDPPHDYIQAVTCGDAAAICGSMLCGIRSATGRADSVVQDELRRMTRLVAKWKSSHAKFVELFIRFPSSDAVYLCDDGADVEAPSASPLCGSMVCGQQSVYVTPP